MRPHSTPATVVFPRSPVASGTLPARQAIYIGVACPNAQSFFIHEGYDHNSEILKELQAILNMGDRHRFPVKWKALKICQGVDIDPYYVAG